MGSEMCIRDSLRQVSYNIESDIGIKVDLDQTVKILIKSYIDKANQKLRAESAALDEAGEPREFTLTLKRRGLE